MEDIWSQNILLAFTIKLLTANVELIKIINRLDYFVSYSKALKLDTAFAIQSYYSQQSLFLMKYILIYQFH